MDVRAAWGVLRRRWRLVLSCLGVGLTTGWLITARTTPAYQASSTLRIAEKESAVPGLDVLKQLGGGETEVSTEMEVLRSRALAQNVVEHLQLRLAMIEPARVPRSRIIASVELSDSAPAGRYRFTRQGDGTFQITRQDTTFSLLRRRTSEPIIGPAGVDREVRLPGVFLRLAPEAKGQEEFILRVMTPSAGIDELQQGLSVSRPNRDANIINVRYRGYDPEIVQSVPNVLVRSFIDQRVQLRKTGARSTVGFLRSQLDTLSHQLRRVEDSLRVFREAERVVSLEAEAGSQVQRLAELQAQRGEVEGERAALERLVVEARSSPASPGQPSPYRRLLAFPTLFRNQATSALLSSLTTLDNERATLLLRRTPKDPDVVSLSGMIADLETQVQGVVLTYLDGLRQQVASFDGSLAGFGKRLEKIPAKEVHYARLQRSNQVLSEIYTLLQTRLKESEIAQAVEDPSAQVVDEAFLPEVPVAPRKGLNLFLSMFLGIGLGLACAFGREWLDTAIHSREELQSVTRVPVLGLIPHIRDARVKYRFRRRRVQSIELRPVGISLSLIAGRDPHGPDSEAYRALRTSLAFVRPDRPPKSIIVTSPAPGDGKSTTVSNLAVTLAQQGLKVIVIDADLRRGTLHRVFGVGREPGLSDLLIGRTNLEAATQEIDLGAEGLLHLIGAGAPPPNPADLLGSNRLRQVLNLVEPLYDVVLVDCPPINLVTDAAIAGTQVDGVLLVARAGKTQRGELAFSMEQLRNVRVPVLGAVLNDFDMKRDASYGGDYSGYRYADAFR
ncbi:MAG: tyrosine-protein kinase Etk/Wzc [Gemmatimonadales bacterium]|nr:tyrosine-protein kinase Etk/Wzc [Gemmatimonadales bacterium]